MAQYDPRTDELLETSRIVQEERRAREASEEKVKQLERMLVQSRQELAGIRNHYKVLKEGIPTDASGVPLPVAEKVWVQTFGHRVRVVTLVRGVWRKVFDEFIEDDQPSQSRVIGSEALLEAPEAEVSGDEYARAEEDGPVDESQTIDKVFEDEDAP